MATSLVSIVTHPTTDPCKRAQPVLDSINLGSPHSGHINRTRDTHRIPFLPLSRWMDGKGIPRVRRSSNAISDCKSCNTVTDSLARSKADLEISLDQRRYFSGSALVPLCYFRHRRCSVVSVRFILLVPKLVFLSVYLRAPCCKNSRVTSSSRYGKLISTPPPAIFINGGVEDWRGQYINYVGCCKPVQPIKISGQVGLSDDAKDKTSNPKRRPIIRVYRGR